MIVDLQAYESLPSGSAKPVDCQCNGCGKIYSKQRRRIENINENFCRICRNKLTKAGNDFGTKAKGTSKNRGNLNSNWRGGKGTPFQKFKAKVHLLTRKQPIETLDNSDKTRGRNGTPGAYQLDHIVSIHEAFHLGWNAEKCADISNLQFIPWEKNLMKSNKTTITKETA